MSLRVFNFRSMLTPTSNRPLDAGNGTASSAQQRPAGKGALSGLSEFNANAAAANRANNRRTGANGAPGTEAVFVGQRPPASLQQPAVWRSSTQAGYGVHVPNVGTFLAANLDEAQALLGKHGVQFGATNASAPAQRPAPARLNIPSQKPNAGPQAMMVDSRPAATSRRPAVWPSSTQQGYGVHVPGSGAFLAIARMAAHARAGRSSSTGIADAGAGVIVDGAADASVEPHAWPAGFASNATAHAAGEPAQSTGARTLDAVAVRAQSATNVGADAGDACDARA